MERLSYCIILCLVLVSCVSMPVKTGTSDSKSPATGSAAGAYSEGTNTSLERCDTPLGTLALYEDRYTPWYRSLSRYGIQSTEPALRLFAQQSGCFVVVERGKAFRNVQEERQLEASGELRQGSNFGKGQMVSADYTMTPTLIYSDSDTGGIGGAIGGLLGGGLGAAIGGGIKIRSAQSILTLVDNRSTVQVAVAEGSSRGMDLGAISGLFGSGAGGVLGAYTKTPEGKVIVGAMLDSYNNMIKAARYYQPQAASGPKGHGTGGKLQVDDTGTKPDRETIKEVQTLLNKLGYDAGNSDGIPGSKTKKAVSAFQQHSGLPITGEIDSITIGKLRESSTD